MDLIYIGDDFYNRSKSIMSSIYTLDGHRSDWGFVQIELERGGSINIRQATAREKEAYQDRLVKLRKENGWD